LQFWARRAVDDGALLVRVYIRREDDDAKPSALIEREGETPSLFFSGDARGNARD